MKAWLKRKLAKLTKLSHEAEARTRLFSAYNMKFYIFICSVEVRLYWILRLCPYILTKPFLNFIFPYNETCISSSFLKVLFGGEVGWGEVLGREPKKEEEQSLVSHVKYECVTSKCPSGTSRLKSSNDRYGP